MLKINNLQFQLHDQLLFEPITFKLDPGECLQLTGINGVGKSTLLKILAGLLKAKRGSLLWQTQKIPHLAKISKYLGHELGLNANLTVIENLDFYAKLNQVKNIDLETACHYFDLQNYLHKPVESLSAGLKRRCQLTKLLLGQRPIWLLDEPFTSLDHPTIEKLLRLFKNFIEQRGIIIFTSHHPINALDVVIKNFLMLPYL